MLSWWSGFEKVERGIQIMSSIAGSGGIIPPLVCIDWCWYVCSRLILRIPHLLSTVRNDLCCLLCVACAAFVIPFFFFYLVRVVYNWSGSVCWISNHFHVVKFCCCYILLFTRALWVPELDRNFAAVIFAGISACTTIAYRSRGKIFTLQHLRNTLIRMTPCAEMSPINTGSFPNTHCLSSTAIFATDVFHSLGSQIISTPIPITRPRNALMSETQHIIYSEIATLERNI